MVKVSITWATDFWLPTRWTFHLEFFLWFGLRLEISGNLVIQILQLVFHLDYILDITFLIIDCFINRLLLLVLERKLRGKLLVHLHLNILVKVNVTDLVTALNAERGVLKRWDIIAWLSQRHVPFLVDYLCWRSSAPSIFHFNFRLLLFIFIFFIARWYSRNLEFGVIFLLLIGGSCSIVILVSWSLHAKHRSHLHLNQLNCVF